MKFSISSLPCLMLLLWSLGCQKNSSSSSSPLVEPAKLENPAPILNLSPLPENFRPLNLSNKVFSKNGSFYVPMDFKNQTLTFTFDISSQNVKVRSLIFFQLPENGRPYFQLKETLLAARLNGEAAGFETISDPDGLNNFYLAITKELSKSQFAVLELEYELSPDKVSFSNSGVAFLTDMTDLSPAQYFENWAPVGFEDDSFSLTLKLRLQNSKADHRVFTNGILTFMNSQEWVINFPDHFTASSFYVHLTDRALQVQTFSIQTSSRLIPVTLYSEDLDLIEQARLQLPKLFEELEGDYGPYPHAQFLAYLHSGGGGMEYAGATITSLGALDHELFHSWFARGVMPAEGRSGWIDEALASWRDYGYFRASQLLSRSPTVLAAYSPFRKSTPSNCYKDGRQLIAELDLYLSNFGGMKPLMKSFFERYRHRVVTTEEFLAFLKTKTGKNIEMFFDRYIFGLANSNQATEIPESAQDWDSKHPHPLSAEEIRNLR